MVAEAADTRFFTPNYAVARKCIHLIKNNRAVQRKKSCRSVQGNWGSAINPFTEKFGNAPT